MSVAPAMGYMEWLGKVEAAKRVLLTSCVTARRIIGALFDTTKRIVQE